MHGVCSFAALTDIYRHAGHLVDGLWMRPHSSTEIRGLQPRPQLGCYGAGFEHAVLGAGAGHAEGTSLCARTWIDKYKLRPPATDVHRDQTASVRFSHLQTQHR